MSKRYLIEQIQEAEIIVHPLISLADEVEENLDCPPRAISRLLRTASDALEEARGWCSSETLTNQ